MLYTHIYRPLLLWVIKLGDWDSSELRREAYATAFGRFEFIVCRKEFGFRCCKRYLVP